MRARLAIALAALAGALALPATAGASTPYVYVVVIDGLDGDRVDQGRAPFISALLAGDEDNDATYYPGSRSVMPAVTNANHVAMMSGAYSEASGIAGNAFAIYAPLESEDSCARTGPLDFGSMPSFTSGESATCPQAQFAFEAVKRQAGHRRPTTAAIFGKPKLGRIFAGRNINDRLDVDHLWAPCASGADDDDYCDSDVPTNPISGYTLADSFVMDEVIRTIEEKVKSRGELRRPRLTFVNLPQVDSAGHAFTPSAPPYDEAIALADDEIERLVGTLESEGIWDRSVLVLLSDHSMDTAPTKINPSSVFDEAGIPSDSYLPVDGDNGSAEMIYLADRRDAGRHELLKQMRDAILAEPGVAEALYREPNPEDGGNEHTSAAAHPSWHVSGTRSGDLFITSEPGYSFADPDLSSNPFPGGHGAPQTRDNFLAVIGAPDLVRQGTVEGDGRARNPINVDVAPTVMELLGLQPPADNRGRALRLALD